MGGVMVAASKEGARVGFDVGDLVAVRADPARVGSIMKILSTVDGFTRYRVFHGPDAIREYAEDQLVGARAMEPADHVLAPEAFRAALTAARLSHPLTDQVYSYRGARIRFVPFQFRPLLRILRADQPRMLIADDVGVGKTIEAGLIMKELAARQPLDRVLVVCPKALTVKWREEMRRFDEEFRVLDSAGLRYCLNEAYLEGTWPHEYRRAVVHYELFRLDAYLKGVAGIRAPTKGLLELDPAPHFDLLIADEAHHLRTPGTSVHELAEYLARISEAVLLLSATPVQTSSRDLLVLLNLLRPDLFRDSQSLAEVLAPNRHLAAAARALRAGSDEAGPLALAGLQQAAATLWGRQTIEIDPRYQAVCRRLAGQALTHDERVRSIRDVEELNTLAPLVNRTRRRDIGPFTIREPHTVAVAFTDSQKVFYRRLLDARREQLLRRHDSVVVRLIMDTLERQAASCLPALAQRIAAGGDLTVTEISDDPEIEPDQDPGPQPTLPVDPRLRALARDLPPEDPKLERLLGIVADAIACPGPGKLLVFSFFLHTLDYLAAQLRAAGVRVGVVTGRLEEAQRQQLRDQFRAGRDMPDAIDVLLSSEVGCEGLDYEFCDRLVNYDIPWNPMRIEQRIGRIDRFGQQSPKVLIVNFVTPGTVEERVFHRCWERLGLFRDTLGDLEGVLGEITQGLNELATSTDLTAAQIEERASQLADNAVRLVAERQSLEESSDELIGIGETFTQDLDALVEQGRAVTEGQIEELVRAYVTAPPMSGQLVLTPDGLLRLRLSRQGRAHLAQALDDTAASLTEGRPLQHLRAWLAGDEGPLDVTSSAEVASDNRLMGFLTATHPLVRVAARGLAPAEGQQLRANLTVNDPTLAEGRYAFACHVWETIAVRPELRTVAFAVDVATLTPAADVQRRLLALLATAGPAEPAPVAVDAAFTVLDEYAEQARREAVAGAHDLNEVLLARRLGSLAAHHQSVRSRLEQRLEQVSEPRIHRMLIGQLARAVREFERGHQRLLDRAKVDVISHPIASGLLVVTYA